MFAFLISVCGIARDWERGTQFFYEMENLGLEHDILTLRSLLFCARQNRYEFHSRSIFREIENYYKERGERPPLSCYIDLFLVLFSKKRYEEALQIILPVKDINILNVSRLSRYAILGAACNVDDNRFLECLSMYTRAGYTIDQTLVDQLGKRGVSTLLEKFSQFFEGDIQIDPSLQKDNQLRMLKGTRVIQPSTFSLDDEDDYDTHFVVDSSDEEKSGDDQIN